MSARVGEALTSFPAWLSIETVGSCNARCTFCPHPLLDKNSRHEFMTDEVFTAVLRQSAGRPELDSVTLSFQNEPLTDLRLPERIRAAREALGGVELGIVTNGSLLRGKRLERLMADPPDFMKISVSAIDADEYERNMVGLRYAQVMENILRVRDLADARGGTPRLLINCVYPVQGTRRTLREITDFWRERRIAVHVINLENRGGFFPLEEMRRLTDQRWHERVWCNRPETQLSVWPNGDVALCCADWRKEVVLGNVMETPLHEIWHGEVVARYRAALRAGRGDTISPCSTCDQAQIEFEGQVFVDAGNLAESILP